MTTKLDPIIAVKNVAASAIWYEQVFGFRNAHGGDLFAVLVSDDDEVILCLHKWGEHNHPTMTNQSLPVGNGFLLYFRTADMQLVYRNALGAGCMIEEEIHLNPNSLRQEFSFRDPGGYLLPVTEMHNYEG